MKRIVALLVLFVFFLSIAPAAHAYETPVTSANKDEHFYVNAQRWNDPITSTLEVTEDGYTRVEYVGDRLIAEKYDRNFRFISGREIQLELPIYGGVYLGQDYNFVVEGQLNMEEDDTKEVFRIIRYSKDWVRQASASIYGANTTVPFDAGCLRFARSGNILYIRTAHEMYADANGINHQANVMISVRISDMTVTDQLTKTWNQSYGYVSHSFNQFVLVDGSTLLAVDHGDYYPRSVVLFKYPTPAGQETFYSRVSYVNALPIVNSSYHYNDTGVSVGGFEASSDHYLIAGCSADQTEVVDLMEAHRNIFVTATPKNNFTDDGTTLRWLTSFKEEDNVEVSPPHLVKLSADRFFLIWTENGQIRYCTLDGKGEVEGEILSAAGDLSDCVPVVDNGKVIWYVTDFSAPKFYVIDPDAHSHNYTSVITEPTCSQQGYTTYTCADCGDSYVTDYTNPVDHVYENGSCKWCGILASGICGENLTWVLSGDYTLTISGTGEMYDFTGSTQPWEDYTQDITAVVIEDGATSVGNYAFFHGYDIASVKLPDSVKAIGTNAFFYCRSLTAIQLPAELTTIGDHAFGSCYALEEADLPAKLVTIGKTAFSGSLLSRALIPEGVTSIGLGAFRGCPLTQVQIPASLTQIGFEAFQNCAPLTYISVDTRNPAYCNDAQGAMYNKNRTTLIVVPGGFAGKFVIPETVTQVEASAFAYCTGMTSVQIPDSVTAIGESAFYHCEKLESVVLPGSLAEVKKHTFGWCSSLSSVTIPKSVTAIQDSAFSYCVSLTAITFQGNAPTFGTVYVFKDVTATAYYPANNATWTEDVMQDYGGSITWVPYTYECSNHSFSNGFRTDCDAYEPAVLKGDVYEISNAGQLYWFARKVNGGEDALNGKLIADITVNENLLTDDGQLASSNLRSWTPICENSQGRYNGTFDGNFKTISGLYFGNGSTDYVGLFGCLGQNGLVKNLGVLDTWFRGSSYVGAIVGLNYGTVNSCYSSAIVNGGRYVGGIAGRVDGCFDMETGRIYDGTVTYCYSLSYVQGDDDAGGIAGYVMNSDDHTQGCGIVTSCFFLSDRAPAGEAAGKAVTSADFASGEIAYYLGDAFGQAIGTDPMPVFGGQKVYRNQTGGCTESSFTYVYSNTQAAAVTTHDMTAATCQEASHCTRCGMTQGTPLGHRYETTVVEPTCLKGGYSETKCANCGDSYIHGETGPLGHDHVGTVTEPTCQEGGYTTYICSRCGDSYVGNYTDPVDHLYEDNRCKWCGHETKDYSFKWYSGTTSLNGTIDLNIYVLLSEDLRNAPDAFVRFSYAGKTVDVPMAEALHSPIDKYPNRYRFSCPMYAAEVTEVVTIRMMLGEEMLGKELNYGIVTYCMNQINKSQDEAQVALCKALLNYASAAQVTLNYKTESLANAGMNPEDKVLPENIDVSDYRLSLSGSQAGIKAKSATLMLESDVSVRVYFTLEAGYDISDFTFTLNGNVVTPQHSTKGWYVETKGIIATDLEQMHTFCVGGITVKYGPMSYVFSKLSSTTTADVNLAKAVYAYWQAAEALLG